MRNLQGTHFSCKHLVGHSFFYYVTQCTHEIYRHTLTKYIDNMIDTNTCDTHNTQA